jgi:Holliday junction resolvasome RuvABC endonuclease subunit
MPSPHGSLYLRSAREENQRILHSSPQQLLAIDPSLTCSGWALFSVASGRPIAFDVIRPPGTDVELSVRYDILQQQVMELILSLSLVPGDFLICEGPAPLVKNPESALRVERVRSIFEAVGRMHQLRVMPRLNPRTVQSELLGLRGKQIKRDLVKEIARETAARLFPDETYNKKLSQDSVDALLIGALATSKVQIHLRTGVEIGSLFQPKEPRNSRRDSYRGWRVSNG